MFKMSICIIFTIPFIIDLLFSRFFFLLLRFHLLLWHQFWYGPLVSWISIFLSSLFANVHESSVCLLCSKFLLTINEQKFQLGIHLLLFMLDACLYYFVFFHLYCYHIVLLLLLFHQFLLLVLCHFCIRHAHIPHTAIHPKISTSKKSDQSTAGNVFFAIF